MTTGIVEPATTPPPIAGPSKNVFERIAGVLFAPAETFQDIVRKPDFLWPIVILLVAYLVATAFVTPRVDWSYAETMEADAIKAQSPNLSDADIQRMQGYSGTARTITGWVSPLLWIGVIVIVSGVLFLGFRLLGGDGTFSQAISVTLYAWIPLAIFRIIRAVVVVARGSVDAMELGTIVKSNAAFLVDFKEQAALFAILGSLDIFIIWTVVLLTIGFATLSRFSKAKSAAIVGTLWAVLLLFNTLMAMWGASRMKG